MTEDDDATFFSTLALNLSKALNQIVEAVGLNPDDDVLEATIARVQRIAARDVALQRALDAKEAEIREWAAKHNPSCECEVESTWLEAIAWFRGLPREAS